MLVHCKKEKIKFKTRKKLNEEQCKYLAKYIQAFHVGVIRSYVKILFAIGKRTNNNNNKNGWKLSKNHKDEKL